MVTSAGGKTGVVVRSWWAAVAGGGDGGREVGSPVVVVVHVAPKEECTLAASQHEAVEIKHIYE